MCGPAIKPRHLRVAVFMTEFFLYESVIVLLKYRSGSSFWFVVCLFKQGPTPLNRETDRPTSFIIVYGSVIYFSLTSLIKSFVRNLISFVCVNASSRTHTHTARCMNIRQASFILTSFNRNHDLFSLTSAVEPKDPFRL